MRRKAGRARRPINVNSFKTWDELMIDPTSPSALVDGVWECLIVDPPGPFAPVDVQRAFIADNAANPHPIMVHEVAQAREHLASRLEWDSARSTPDEPWG